MHCILKCVHYWQYLIVSSKHSACSVYIQSPAYYGSETSTQWPLYLRVIQPHTQNDLHIALTWIWHLYTFNISLSDISKVPWMESTVGIDFSPAAYYRLPWPYRQQFCVSDWLRLHVLNEDHSKPAWSNSRVRERANHRAAHLPLSRNWEIHPRANPFTKWHDVWKRQMDGVMTGGWADKS